MNGAVHVSVPRTGRALVLPDCCLGCGDSDSTRMRTIWAKASGKPSNPIRWGPELSVERVQVPLCNRCTFQRKIRFALSFFILFIVLIVSSVITGSVFVFDGQNPKSLRFFPAMMIAVGGLGTILWSRWRERNPIRFDVTDLSEGLDFEFADEEMAQQFEALNRREGFRSR